MGIPKNVVVTVGGAALCLEYLEQICDVYEEIFSGPPFAVGLDIRESHEQLLHDLMDDDTFGVALAAADSDLVGFAYGHVLPVDHRWWTRLEVEQPADLVAEWDGRTFGLIDLGVKAKCRRRHIGSTIVTALLASRSEERAALSVQPTAEAAHRFYQANGWKFVSRKGPIPGIVPPFWNLFVRDLTQDQR